MNSRSPSSQHPARRKQMSTRGTQTALMNAACQELLNERLDLRIGRTPDLGPIPPVLAGRVDVPAMRSLIASPEVSGVLGRLAPEQFAGAQAALTMPVTTVTMPSVAVAARSALADAVTA